MSPSAHRRSGTPDAPLTLAGKVALALRIWMTYFTVRVALRREPLPVAVVRLGDPDGRPTRSVSLLSHAVSRALRVGPWRPRCLTRSLVLYRLLRAQGAPAEIVIGLPSAASNWDAHAWVELAGRDVGPYPGRFGHEELARYPQEAPPGVPGA